jgi:hypothetical protein
VLQHGDHVKQSARKLLNKPGRSRGQSLKYEGVFVDKTGKWVAQISSGGKAHFLGRYNSEEEAAIAWGKAMQAPKQVQEPNKVKLGDKTVDLRGKDKLLEMNYANAKARGVTPAASPPVPAPLRVNAMTTVSVTTTVGGGGNAGTQLREHAAAAAAAAAAKSASSASAVDTAGLSAAAIAKRKAEQTLGCSVQKLAKKAPAPAPSPNSKMRINTWKPFQCPEPGCHKCYTHARPCANHPKHICQKIEVLLAQRAAAAKAVKRKKKKQESSSSEESSSDDDSDDEDDDEEDNKAPSSAPPPPPATAAAAAAATTATAPTAAAAAAPAPLSEATTCLPATDASAAPPANASAEATAATAATAAADQPPLLRMRGFAPLERGLSRCHPDPGGI